MSATREGTTEFPSMVIALSSHGLARVDHLAALGGGGGHLANIECVLHSRLYLKRRRARGKVHRGRATWIGRMDRAAPQRGGTRRDAQAARPEQLSSPQAGQCTLGEPQGLRGPQPRAAPAAVSPVGVLAPRPRLRSGKCVRRGTSLGGRRVRTGALQAHDEGICPSAARGRRESAPKRRGRVGRPARKARPCSRKQG